MIPVVAALIANGLPILANALLAKGKEAVEAKIGVKLPDVSVGTTIANDKLLELKRLEIEHEESLAAMTLEQYRIEADIAKAEEAETSRRWTADMQSDSWLSKNVRPVVMLYLVGALTLFALGSINVVGLSIADGYIELFGELANSAIYAYFGGRTLEKGVKMWKDRHDPKK